MSTPNKGDGTDSSTNRRRVLQGLGAAGIAGLAGCGGQEASDNTERTTPDVGGSQTSVESEEAQNAVQELAWLTNQTLPVLPIQEKLAQTFLTTDDWDVPATDSEDTQVYWPTEWLPREGKWQATGDDDRLTVAQWAVPSDSQYNPWNGRNYAEPRRMLFDRFMKYNLANAEFSGYAVSDWEFGDQSLTLTVRDGLTWHDGDAVTATDVVTQLKLDMYTGGALATYVNGNDDDGEFGPDDVSAIAEGVSAPDDSTVEIQFAQQVNNQIVLSYLQPKRLVGKESEYGSYVEEFESAGSVDEISEVTGELSSASVTDPVGCGPFQFEDADSSRTLLTKFEDHPDAGNINFPESEYLFQPNNNGRWSALINGETDGSATLFMPENRLNQLPDYVNVGLIPRHWGMGLLFNHGHDHVSKVNVRKAIAHVIERESVATNSAAGTRSKVGVSIPCGLTGNFSGQVEDVWLDGVAGEFNEYETDHDAAAALLEEEGYSKEDGTWMTPDGEPLEIPLKCPAGFSDWVAGAETLVDHLDSFGFETQLITKDNGTYWGTDLANSDFVLALDGWANYNHSYPYFHFDRIYRSNAATNQWQVPSEWEAPPLSDPEGDAETWNPADLLSELSRQSQI